jgi:hypothetical protein
MRLLKVRIKSDFWTASFEFFHISSVFCQKLNYRQRFGRYDISDSGTTKGLGAKSDGSYGISTYRKKVFTPDLQRPICRGRITQNHIKGLKTASSGEK